MCEKKDTTNFEKLFDLEETQKTREVFDHSMNFRTAKRKNKMLDEEVELMASVGIRVSKNDLINWAIDIVFGYRQHSENAKHFYRGKLDVSLGNYITENKQEIVERVKNRMFEKELDIMSQTIKTKKDKKNQLQQMRRIAKAKEKIDTPE